MHQILGGYCKGEASIFKSIVDLIMKKIIQRFHTIYNIFEKKNLFINPPVARCKNVLERNEEDIWKVETLKLIQVYYQVYDFFLQNYKFQYSEY